MWVWAGYHIDHWNIHKHGVAWHMHESDTLTFKAYGCMGGRCRVCFCAGYDMIRYTYTVLTISTPER